MAQGIGLGCLVGLVVGVLCWRGNRTDQVVSTFPDAVTFIALALLLAFAIRFVLHGRQLVQRSASLRMGLSVATAAGVVFGGTVVGLGLVRSANPSPLLHLFGFFTAFISALGCGLVATLATTGIPRRRAA